MAALSLSEELAASSRAVLERAVNGGIQVFVAAVNTETRSEVGTGSAEMDRCYKSLLGRCVQAKRSGSVGFFLSLTLYLIVCMVH